MKSQKKYKNIVSIGIPVWIPNKDKEQYIRWTLNSLNNTTDKLFELIIIDNESRARSKKLLSELVEQFKKNKYCVEIKVVASKKNLGWTGAWELFIRNSVGKYTCVINDDLVFEDKWLSKMLKHIKGDVAAVGPTSNFVSGRQLVKYNAKGSYEEKVNYLIGFCLLVTRKALDNIKDEKDGCYIDQRFYPGGSEELDLCIRLGRAGHDMVIARDVFIHHFGNRSLNYIDEFQQGNRNFYNKRLQLLEDKYDRETCEVLDEYQQCPKIAIGIPSVGMTDAAFLAMYPWILQEAFAKFGFNQILPIVSPRNLTHLGRNEIVKRAIQYGVEYLWFLDDDMIVHPDTLWRLYSHQKDYVSALAFTRLPPYKPCSYKGKDIFGDWSVDMSLRKGLVEVDATGLSCALIKVSAIKKLIGGRKNIARIKKRGGLFHFTKFGEDMNFTNELKKSGTKIWMDTDLIIKHLGQKAMVDDRTFLQYLQKMENNKLENKKVEENRGQIKT